MRTERRPRLDPGTFQLPLERMRNGYYSDAYFTFTRGVLERDDHHPEVLMQVFQREHSVLGGVDEAIRRRMHLIPFNVTIPAADRDPTLADRLKEEWPGILAWMIDGCLAWQEQGLDPPESVRAWRSSVR